MKMDIEMEIKKIEKGKEVEVQMELERGREMEKGKGKEVEEQMELEMEVERGREMEIEMEMEKEEMENEANRQKARAERLTFVYLIYQVLVFFFISGYLPESPGADYWWVPFSFSLSLGAVFFMSFIDTVTRFHQIQGRLDLTRMGCTQICRSIYTTELISDVPRTPEEVRFREVKRMVVLSVVGGLLVAFEVVMLVGCWLISPESGGSLTGLGD